MATHIALLRGINVSGHKIIKMADLRNLMSKIGLENVRTYIQSGNIIFESKIKSNHKLENQIQKAILDAYGFEVPIIVKKPTDLKHALALSPFEKNALEEPSKYYVVFLKEKPTDEAITVFNDIDFSPEIVSLNDTILYFFPTQGAAKSKLTNSFFEKKLKVTATGRNWRTVTKLLELATS